MDVNVTSMEMNVDSLTYVPHSLARSHQSLRTMSKPLSSCLRLYRPSPWFSTTRAAYFFFFSSRRALNTPSMSISSSLYSLFTSAFTWDERAHKGACGLTCEFLKSADLKVRVGVTASHLVAKFEHFLQRLAVGVDHDGVGVSVDDFQIHLSRGAQTETIMESQNKLSKI